MNSMYLQFREITSFIIQIKKDLNINIIQNQIIERKWKYFSSLRAIFDLPIDELRE